MPLDPRDRLGYMFESPALLREALSHPSLRESDAEHVTYRRFAYLGDAVIELAVRRRLTPVGMEPRTTDADKQRLVRRGACGEAARSAGLVLAQGKSRAGVEATPDMLGEAFEAVIGAVFEEAGFDAAAAVALKHLDLRSFQA